MQSIKNFFKYLKVQKAINQIINIKELHFIQDQYFHNVITSINNIQKHKSSEIYKIFTDIFKKYLYNQKLIIRVLLIIHQILRQSQSFQLSDMLIQILFQLCKQLKQIPQQQLQGIDSYLKKSFSVPYTTYLIKAFRKQSKQQFQKQKFSSKLKGKEKQVLNKNQRQNNPFQNIEMDFTVFNMVNDVIKLNGDFHQMGRFYSDHQYAINIFLEMLRDFQIYFNKISKTFYQLISLKRQEIKEEDTEKVYLYLSESERCVNKMNSFYFNKYLYYYINNRIELKMQLQIPQFFYKVLNKSYKGHQRKLSYDYCLTTSSQGLKQHLQQTKESNRSKHNDVSKIIQSIDTINEALNQIYPEHKIQRKKSEENQSNFSITNMTSSALF